MILVAVSFPLGFLCLYLACLGWRKNQRASAVLLLFAALILGVTVAISALFLLFSGKSAF